MKEYILVVVSAPRSQEQKYVIGKLIPEMNREENNQAPAYQEWEVGTSFEVALERVAELNRVKGGA
jgi:hypothetical protein